MWLGLVVGVLLVGVPLVECGCKCTAEPSGEVVSCRGLFTVEDLLSTCPDPVRGEILSSGEP
jgi:hypothetical protein